MGRNALDGFLDYLLEHPFDFPWSVQGLGMLRLYLNDRDRLNIWHNDGRIGASPIHDHYWGFQSFILAGKLINERYIQSPDGLPKSRFKIITGEGTVVLEGPEDDNLKLVSSWSYYPGETYTQIPADIHETQFIDGTMTIIRRTQYLEQRDRANVWTDRGLPYVSAEPRAATKDEIMLFVDAAKNQLKEARNG